MVVPFSTMVTQLPTILTWTLCHSFAGLVTLTAGPATSYNAPLERLRVLASLGHRPFRPRDPAQAIELGYLIDECRHIA